MSGAGKLRPGSYLGVEPVLATPHARSSSDAAAAASAAERDQRTLRSENRRLRQRLRALTDEAAKNQRTLANFQRIELGLLGAAVSLPGLLARLTTTLPRALRLDEVTLVLADRDHELRHLLAHLGTDADALESVLLVDDLESVNPLYGHLRAPWLGAFRAREHSPPLRGDVLLRSVAILPLVRAGDLIGSLNFGSADAARYTPHLATDFLSRLATISTVCLESATNRERVVLSGLTDVLTGCQNRQYLARRLPEEIARSARHATPLSALLLDADHFKSVNDNYGHLAGDALLRALARRLRGTLRACDVAVRYGGEEFLVLLPQTRLHDAARLAERVRAVVANDPFPLDERHTVRVTVSVGVAELRPPFHTEEPEGLGEQLLGAADAALYRAKASGRNRVAVSGA